MPAPRDPCNAIFPLISNCMLHGRHIIHVEYKACMAMSHRDVDGSRRPHPGAPQGSRLHAVCPTASMAVKVPTTVLAAVCAPPAPHHLRRLVCLPAVGPGRASWLPSRSARLKPSASAPMSTPLLSACACRAATGSRGLGSEAGVAAAREGCACHICQATLLPARGWRHSKSGTPTRTGAPTCSSMVVRMDLRSASSICGMKRRGRVVE